MKVNHNFNNTKFYYHENFHVYGIDNAHSHIENIGYSN